MYQNQRRRIFYLNVLVVEPGYAPYEKEINGLREMQAVVGGDIQAIYPYQEPVAIVCNDEGILKHLPFNRSIEAVMAVCSARFLSADRVRNRSVR